MNIPTGKQLDSIHDLQHTLHLSAPALNTLCQQRFECDFAQITRAQATSLIEEMKRWKAVPADLKREMGQQDLFEMAG